MKSADRIIYWAEEALGEPFPAQDYSFIKRGYRQGLFLSGLAFVSTVSIGVALSSALAPTRLPIVPLVTLEMARKPRAQAANIPATSDANPAPTPPTSSTAMRDAAVDSRLAAAEPKPESSPPSRAAPKAPPASGDTPYKPTISREKPVPKQAARELPIAPGKPMPQVDLGKAAGAQLALPLQELHVAGISAAAATKPQDIAPAEKLGIKDVYAEGIELLNGKRVRNGATLPNGEVLMGTDPVKRMVETDRRVMTLAR